MRTVRTFVSLPKVLCPALGLLIAGCAVERITPVPEMPASEGVTDSQKLAQLSVAIERTDYGRYSYRTQQFFDALNRAAIFRSVSFVGEIDDPPDLVISGFHDEFDSPRMGWLDCLHGYPTVLSLGLIPAYCWEERTLEFSLRSAQGETIRLRERYKHETITGWAAVPLASFRKWELADDTFDEFLRHRILARADEIIAATNARR